jgi:hypothetical protein
MPLNVLLALVAVIYQAQLAYLAVLLVLLVSDQQTVALNVSQDQSLKMEFAQAVL